MSLVDWIFLTLWLSTGAAALVLHSNDRQEVESIKKDRDLDAARLVDSTFDLSALTYELLIVSRRLEQLQKEHAALEVQHANTFTSMATTIEELNQKTRTQDREIGSLIAASETTTAELLKVIEERDEARAMVKELTH